MICKKKKKKKQSLNIHQYLQVFPLPDILPWEVYHLCLVSQPLGFEQPGGKKTQSKRTGIREVRRKHISSGVEKSRQTNQTLKDYLVVC